MEEAYCSNEAQSEDNLEQLVLSTMGVLGSTEEQPSSLTVRCCLENLDLV